MRMRNILLLAGGCCAALAFFCWQKKGSTAQPTIPTVRVCQVIEHEALNAVVTGLKEVLNRPDRPCQVVVENCQGNAAIAAQMLEKFANSPTDVCVTIGTIPSQVAYKLAKAGQLKVVFSSVTNPADIAPDLKNVNMTGVSNFVELRPQLELFRKLQPSLKTLGVLYNTAEANSGYIIRALIPLCEEMGIRLVTQGVSKVPELTQATEKLVKTVDAVFISNDNLVLSCMDYLCFACAKQGIPVYVSDTDQVAKGCLAALGPNQEDIGRQTGRLVQRVLQGEDINTIAVEYPSKTELVLNKSKAPFALPDDLLRHATKVH